MAKSIKLELDWTSDIAAGTNESINIKKFTCHVMSQNSKEYHPQLKDK